LECYSIIRRTGKSLLKLQSAGYSADYITFLVMDGDRQRVAKAVQISVQSVLALGCTFESALKATVSELATLQFGYVNQDSVDSVVERQDENYSLTAKCEGMLVSMGLSSYRRGDSLVWDYAVQSLQLGVLSYSGAHIQRFDLDLGAYYTISVLPFWNVPRAMEYFSYLKLS